MMKKIVLLLVMALSISGTALAAGQSSGLIFTGKIEEIALKTNMMPNLSSEKYLSIKLDTESKMDFRINTKDAASFGLIENAKTPALLTPSKIKGIGWKVRLTCDKKTTLGDPIYMVTNLKRLD